MEIEIARYLEEVSKGHLSDDTKRKIRDMLRQIGELESIGDACFKLARTIQHRQNSREDFTTQQYNHLHEMLQLVNEALSQMMIIVSGRQKNLTLEASQDIEHDINTLCNKLKDESLQNIDNQEYSHFIGSIYNDIITECEKLGDYIMNVTEARLGKNLLCFQGLCVNVYRKTVIIDGASVTLTRTEFELLRLLLSNRGHVLSRQQLMEEIWTGVIVTDRTVNVHITRLRKKLGPYADHIVSRQGFGYIFEI
jgi:phosphate:Na+ symporter